MMKNVRSYFTISHYPSFCQIKKNGITGKDLIDALENFKNWDSGVLPPITYSRNDHAGVESVMLLQLQGGKQVEITDWID